MSWRQMASGTTQNYNLVNMHRNKFQCMLSRLHQVAYSLSARVLAYHSAWQRNSARDDCDWTQALWPLRGMVLASSLGLVL